MRKKSNFKKDIYVGIITGIISTLVISWFINPLTDLIFPKILALSESVYIPFADSLYRKAATFTVERTSLLNYVNTSTCAMMAAILFCYLCLLTKYKIQDQLDEINDLLNPTTHMSSDEMLRSLKENKKYLHAKQKTYRKLSIMQIISTICLCLIILFSEMIQIFGSSISANTRANIEIVAPYISDQEYKQLKSDFFTIKSKSDYDNLQKALNMISEEHQLDLKE